MASNNALDLAVAAAQRAVPDCVAVGLIDLHGGLALATKTLDSQPATALALVAGATSEMFQGPTIAAIEQEFRKARGEKESGEHYIRKIAFWSKNLLHYGIRSSKNENLVLMFVCRIGANVGMVMAKGELELGKVEAAAGI